MSDLSAAEMKEYNEISAAAKIRELTPHERIVWPEYGKRYAAQLERERAEHQARRAKDMEEFLAEKKAWAEARDAAEVKGEAYSQPEPIRDFKEWLVAKGRA